MFLVILTNFGGQSKKNACRNTYLGSIFISEKYVFRVCFESPFTRMISSLKYKWPPREKSMGSLSERWPLTFGPKFKRLMNENLTYYVFSGGGGGATDLLTSSSYKILSQRCFFPLTLKFWNFFTQKPQIFQNLRKVSIILDKRCNFLPNWLLFLQFVSKRPQFLRLCQQRTLYFFIWRITESPLVPRCRRDNVLHSQLWIPPPKSSITC